MYVVRRSSRHQDLMSVIAHCNQKHAGFFRWHAACEQPHKFEISSFFVLSAIILFQLLFKSVVFDFCQVIMLESPCSCQEDFRQSFSSRLVVVRQLFGSCLAVVWQLTGSRQAVVRRSSGSCHAFVSSGSRYAVVRQSSGSHQTVVSSGSCQAVVRQILGSRQAFI